MGYTFFLVVLLIIHFYLYYFTFDDNLQEIGKKDNSFEINGINEGNINIYQLSCKFYNQLTSATSFFSSFLQFFCSHSFRIRTGEKTAISIKFSTMEQPFKLEIFLPARQSLLQFHEERELVIRTCRDINSYSKKLIFACHRINNWIITDGIETQLKEYLEILAASLQKIDNIKHSTHFTSYKSTISNCVEEMIEGFTFLYYILHQQILSYPQLLHIVDMLIGGVKIELMVLFLGNSDGTSTLISPGDYFMGLFDLTGEIMRYSITNLIDPTTKQLNPQVINNLSLLQAFDIHLSNLFHNYPNLNVSRGKFSIDYDGKACGSIKKKMDTFKQSLNKVQDMVCDICIRGNEYDATEGSLIDV